ncbi:hypothetical protein KP004_15380 [Geomonas oryzisoli]|uniref:Lipoprotein n=1 Tax=Geomonas oryzisoli TaxID=2847992 RepID=A0ABX8J5Y7_9BACT|nr:hypothetical protein [Geomonas oryzisoli]QWV92561.1 hypothetical protein KP004_15380 [Geomonas oryzisoli]
MRFSFLVVCSLPFLVSGCATKGYVNKQIAPVSCRVDVLESKNAALEQRVNSFESRLATLESQVSQAQLANKAMLDDATAKAADSAQRAEAAATSAAQAAERAEKMFELGQKK